MLVNRRIFGVNLNPRRNRRWLVVLLYTFIGIPFILGSLKHVEGPPELWLYFFPGWIISALIFGNFMFWGKRRGGLLKPFAQDPDRPNDERELAARDSAHYRAYKALFFFISLMLILSFQLSLGYLKGISPTELLYFARMSLYGLFAIAMTLPQAILLWSEPDIDSEPERQEFLSTSQNHL